jgi:hypothetical protein
MNYRLGINILSSYSGERAVYRGVQDASAVVRYLREFYQDYGIDYENIFIWGTSAGSFIGLHLAFTEDDERPVSTFGGGEDPDLGCIDCEGNDYIHNSKPKAVISCWGALVNLDMIDQENNIPTIMFHGTLDPVVLFNSGYPFTGLITLPIVYGSNLIHERLNELHIQNALYFEEGQLHEYWGTLNGNWFGGPNEYYYQILDNSYAHLFTLLQSYQIGDVNTDGNVGIADILLIYDFIDGNLQLMGIQYSLADYDSNGIVNSLDANILINTILNFN